MTATQLMGVAPAWRRRFLASSWASVLIPPEQSLTKKTRYPAAIAETAVCARQTSVQRPAISNVRRPVASTEIHLGGIGSWPALPGWTSFTGAGAVGLTEKWVDGRPRSLIADAAMPTLTAIAKPRIVIFGVTWRARVIPAPTTGSEIPT